MAHVLDLHIARPNVSAAAPLLRRCLSRFALLLQCLSLACLILCPSPPTAVATPVLSGTGLATFGQQGAGGSCGYDTRAASLFGAYVVGLSAPLYLDGTSCGACYTVTCSNSPQCRPGVSVTVTVIGSCGGGGGGGTNSSTKSSSAASGSTGGNYSASVCSGNALGLNLSPEAFDAIALTRNPGTIPVSFFPAQCPRSGGLQFTVTSASASYFAVLVHNVGGAGWITGVSVSIPPATAPPVAPAAAAAPPPPATAVATAAAGAVVGGAAGGGAGGGGGGGAAVGRRWLAMRRSYGGVWELTGADASTLRGKPLSFLVTGPYGEILNAPNVAPPVWGPNGTYGSNTNFGTPPPTSSQSVAIIGEGAGGSCGYSQLGNPFGANVVGFSEAIYGNGAVCGGCYELRCVNSSICRPGASAVVTATNICQSQNGSSPCALPRSALNLSPTVYDSLATARNPGQFPVTFAPVPCQRTGGLRFKVVSGNQYYVALLVGNVNRPGRLAAVFVSVAGAPWRRMARSYGAVWSVDGVIVEGKTLSLMLVGPARGEVLVVRNALPATWKNGEVYASPLNF